MLVYDEGNKHENVILKPRERNAHPTKKGGAWGISGSATGHTKTKQLFRRRAPFSTGYKLTGKK